MKAVHIFVVLFIMFSILLLMMRSGSAALGKAGQKRGEASILPKRRSIAVPVEPLTLLPRKSSTKKVHFDEVRQERLYGKKTGRILQNRLGRVQ